MRMDVEVNSNNEYSEHGGNRINHPQGICPEDVATFDKPYSAATSTPEISYVTKASSNS